MNTTERGAIWRPINIPYPVGVIFRDKDNDNHAVIGCIDGSMYECFDFLTDTPDWIEVDKTEWLMRKFK